MTKLECSVATCAYFDEYLCKRDRIVVSGGEASESTETGCSSFERAGSGAVNSAVSHRKAGELAHVECEAVRCAYNENGRCEAEWIRVEGCSSAEPKKESETMCGMFRAEKR